MDRGLYALSRLEAAALSSGLSLRRKKVTICGAAECCYRNKYPVAKVHMFVAVEYLYSLESLVARGHTSAAAKCCYKLVKLLWF